MLNQRKEITEATPPLLLTTPNGNFHLIAEITKIDSGKYACNCINKKEGELIQYQHEINDTPFHIAENIWELNYGVEIKTLLESDLSEHPARQLWQEWISSS